MRRGMQAFRSSFPAVRVMPHTRMFKTLGSLFAAMTVTALLLSWLDPSVPRSSTRSPEEVMAEAHAAVQEETELASDRWRAVAVVEGPTGGASGRLLSASRSDRDSHFIIDADARTFSLARWREQKPADQQPSTVLIEVRPTREGELMTVSQFDALRALIAALSAEIAGSEGSVPVRLGEEWARAYQVDKQTVFEIAPADGS